MLDFRLSEDQSQIVAAVARTLEKEPAGCGDGQVARLAKLGWIGIALPEGCGGSGGTEVDEALVACEFGRALASPDLLSTQLAGRVAYAGGDLALARSLTCGDQSVGFCVTAAGAGNESDAARYFLRTGPVGRYLGFRDAACKIFEKPGGLSARECLDPDVILETSRASSPKILVDQPDSDGKLVHSAVILLSAMLVGIAAGGRDLAVAYTKTRKQFGRYIAEFQSIKHHCANMHLRARAAFAQTMHAAMLTATELPGAELQAMAALEISMNAAIENGEMAVHIHGGMGFSEECVAHRYLKRAHVLRIISSGVVAGLGTPFERLSASVAAPSID